MMTTLSLSYQSIGFCYSQGQVHQMLKFNKEFVEPGPQTKAGDRSVVFYFANKE